MQRSSDDLFFDQVLSDDEFDQLCSELLQVEPPRSLVEDILHSVAGLPSSHPQSGQSVVAKRHACEG